MKISVGDRLTLQTEINTNGGPYSEKIKAGTICTLYSDNEEVGVVRFGTDKNSSRPKLASIEKSILKPSNPKELKKADYTKLISESFFPGNKFKVVSGGILKEKDRAIKIGEILTITGVMIMSNESEDLINFVNEEGTKLQFSKKHVDINFSKYDPEVEAKIGEEVIVSDMKEAPRNYYLPGARMIVGPREAEQVVILIREINDNLYDVVNIEGNVRTYTKEKLMPITSREILLQYPTNQVVPVKYSSGKSLIALDSISNNFMLKDHFNPKDIVKVLNLDAVNCNANEDIYEVLILSGNKKDKQIRLSFLELEKHFDVYSSENKEEGEKSISEEFKEELKVLNAPSESSELPEIEVMNDSVHFKINDVTIYGYRFKIEDSTFSIDGKEFGKDDVDTLIKALSVLKEKIL
ncbi:hypothetical protein D3C87_82520 [compost metagenome]